MRKFLKIVSGIVLFFFLAALLAIVIITKLVDPNDYRNQIEQFIYSKTGRSLDIQGDIEWSLFPRVGISLPEVTIGNPKGIEGPSLAHIEKLNLQARLLSLLTGKIDIDEIRIDNAKINLIIDKDNHNNWQQWQARNQPQLTFYAALGKTPVVLHNNKSHSLPIRALSISSLEIHNSRVQLIDRRSNEMQEFRNVDFSLRGFKNDRDFPVQLAYEWILKKSNSALQQRLNATAHVKLAQQQLSLPEFSITSFWIRPELGKLPIDIEGKLSANLQTKQISLPDLTIQIANMTLNGQINIEQKANHPVLSAQLKSNDTALKPLLTALNGSSRLSGQLTWQTTLNGRLDAEAGFVSTLDGQGQIAIADGVLSGINLTNLMQQAIAYTGTGNKPSSSDTTANETVFNSIRGSYTLQQGVLSNNDLVIEFNPYVAKGTGSINLVNDRISYQLTLAGNSSTNKNIELPVLITGSVDHPAIRPDFGKIAEQFFKKEIKNFLTNPNQNLKDTLKHFLP